MSFEYVRFTSTYRSWLYMLVALGAFFVVVFLLLPQVYSVFMASPYLSLVIIVVFIVGILYNFLQLIQTGRAISWIEAQSNVVQNTIAPPILLTPLAVLMKGGQLPTGMSTASTQSILDSVATRMDETRDISRYLTNLLIFLGLLGTFFGLATTIPAIVDTIRSLSQSSNTENILSDLMTGLETQLAGMGTAFGSSLLGLTGSLVIGLLDLFSGHAQNRFYREFEEWLSHFTSVGMAEKGLEIDPNDDTPLAKAFRNLSETMSRLEERLEHQGENFTRIESAFENLSYNLQNNANLTDEMRQTMRALSNQIVKASEDASMAADNQTRALHKDLIAIQATLQMAIDGSE